MESNCKVCVTGGAGYIGSALVHSLLQKGYTVHATLRNLGDESKVGLLKGFPYAQERLHLFEADLYKPQEFEEAIQGCVFVFHVATVLDKANNVVEATVDAVKKILDVCIRSGTVKRLIYTASVVAASPLKDDGSGYNGYKMTVDESCWTPLHLNVSYENDSFKAYKIAKTKSEQEILKFGKEKAGELEVVTLGCGLVGGGGYLPYPGTSVFFLSHITKNVAQLGLAIGPIAHSQALNYLEELLGKVPIVHIEDVCRAHIFCAEMPSVNGRYLCASSYVTKVEIAKYYQQMYPNLNHKFMEEHVRGIKWGSNKLEDKGFVYNYSTKMILDDSHDYVKRLGFISSEN